MLSQDLPAYKLQESTEMPMSIRNVMSFLSISIPEIFQFLPFGQRRV